MSETATVNCQLFAELPDCALLSERSQSRYKQIVVLNKVSKVSRPNQLNVVGLNYV